MSAHPVFDLRSDTVTKPSRAMREAMANAEVGDDMSGEDPTVNRLEAECAALFGKEAAVFACSGTQSNQMAVRVHCQPGDELLCHETAHIAVFEAGAPAALSGVSVRTRLTVHASRLGASNTVMLGYGAVRRAKVYRPRR